jgi:1-phosphatidylinositol-3-phosphate 5-kinase
VQHRLVVGIIDYIRQYTWDKHVETWVKSSGILPGINKQEPTVISPKQYMKRFQAAMETYFTVVPFASRLPEEGKHNERQ